MVNCRGEIRCETEELETAEIPFYTDAYTRSREHSNCASSYRWFSK